ncbi:hypothetical protein [Salipiger aestuarii]|uniref:hypothetical protein n=1 Tax=Salipiger aestuarii TaxID=568098 RepID=UPI00025B6541|nr:hypothetical protein [Salipiger aestuarii]EIE49819.1 hypothetical protein C357_17363 [Citreicella sp. 357]
MACSQTTGAEWPWAHGTGNDRRAGAYTREASKERPVCRIEQNDGDEDSKSHSQLRKPS